MIVSQSSQDDPGYRPKRRKSESRTYKANKKGKSLPKAIATRGTPKGYYEIVRTVSTDITYTTGNFNIGALSVSNISFQFTPISVIVAASPTVYITVNIANAAEFAAIFDRVKISHIDVTIRPKTNTSTDSTAGRTPDWWVCTDQNSGFTPLTVPEIKQRGDCRLIVSNANAGDGVTRFRIRLCFNRVVYYTAVTSSYEPARGYINTGIEIPHYSMHIGNASVTGNGSGAVEFGFKYCFRFKDLK